MRVAVVAVGRCKEPISPVVRMYMERAARYWKLELIEVGEGVKGGHSDPERVRAAEADRILAAMPDGLEVVALTRGGRGMTSAALAKHLSEHALHASPGVGFVIGGAFGLGADVLDRAARRLSLSPMTMPHDLARLVLAEQIYRAGTIVRGEPYHKG